MPILHIEKPRETMALSAKNLIVYEQLVVDLLNLGARVVVCDPDSNTDVTPPLFRTNHLIRRRTAMWLKVDETGQIGTLTHHSNRKGIAPTFVAIGKTNDGEAAMMVGGGNTGFQVGPEHLRQVAISVDKGAGYLKQTVVGGLVLSRTYEETVILMESFGQDPPPPRPPFPNQ